MREGKSRNRKHRKHIVHKGECLYCPHNCKKVTDCHRKQLPIVDYKSRAAGEREDD